MLLHLWPLGALLLLVRAQDQPPGRDRTCCLYNNGTVGDSLCHSRQSCVVSWNGNRFSPPTQSEAGWDGPEADRCRVLRDSKHQPQGLGPAEQCLGQFGVNAQWPEAEEAEWPRFQLRPYPFQDGHSARILPGISLELTDQGLAGEYVRIRILNTDLCPEDVDQLSSHPHCHPRCIEIEQRLSVGVLEYDCEVGFFLNSDQHVVVTANDTYQIDFCRAFEADEYTCSSFYFAMPEAQAAPALLPMLDRTVLLFQRQIAVTLPPQAGFSVLKVFRQSSTPGKYDLVYTENVDGRQKYHSPDILAPGYYIVRVTSDQAGVGDVLLAHFHVVDESGTTWVGILCLVLVLLVLALVIYSYRRYQIVRSANLVSPNRLLEAERISPKNVFIITNVDNRHHIDIVLALSKYLKNHCAVGEVHFALDPRTGIRSHPQHDPWKWAQDVADKMGAMDNACLVFIAAPPPTMGLCIYKDLPNNQAFVTTKYLKNMCDDNRVAIVHLPYSDPETIPGLVPPHLRASPWLLPKDMNSFLCQLLEIKKRELYPCIPLPIVQPQVVAQDFEKFPGGRELLENISNLTAKADRHKAEQKASTSASLNGGVASSTLSRITEFSTFSDSEERGLLRPKKADGSQTNKSPTPDSKVAEETPEALKIEIEPQMFSLKDTNAPNRNQATDPEFLT
eukprot:maker-scaffold149_size310270-snap-gene-2.21 protein:Tk01271 transcript:maker-scaffold149_size310270-snap-gene-2.21-mRNA-1 annotation:"hypothetical protein L798_06975"